MAAFATLSPEDQAALQNWSNLQRGFFATFGKLLNVAASIDTLYNAEITTILAKFATNETIPNTSGLAGSVSLNVGSESVTLESHIQALLTAFNDTGHRQMWAKAAGISNLV